MVRTIDKQRPVDLLDAIVDHLISAGVMDLSLRPLAKAVHSSPRVLLYYFGSKEQLMVKALARLRERQRVIYDSIRNANFDTPSEACRMIWREMSSTKSEPLFRLFFEAYSMALHDPESFSDFLRTAIEDWMDFLSASLITKGISKKDARAFATILLAGFRGFMLDFCATHDRLRVSRAVDLWVQALDTIKLEKEIADAR
jgi:AcrR family transcriptional regulator